MLYTFFIRLSAAFLWAAVCSAPNLRAQQQTAPQSQQDKRPAKQSVEVIIDFRGASHVQRSGAQARVALPAAQALLEKFGASDLKPFLPGRAPADTIVRHPKGWWFPVQTYPNRVRVTVSAKENAAALINALKRLPEVADAFENATVTLFY